MSGEDHYLKAELYDLVSRDLSVFEFLQEGSLDGIWYWDLESPENEWMSPGFWKTLGYDPAEKKHLASEWKDLIHPEDLDVAVRNFTLHCEDPDHPYDQVVRYRHQDGSTVWVRCRGIAIRDGHGTPVRMLGAHTDLTLQKRAEEELGKSEEFLRAVFDSMQDGITVLAPDLTILRVNRVTEERRSDKAPLEGRFCFEVYHDRSEPCEVCPTLRAMETGRAERSEVTRPGGDGETRFFEVTAYPMQEEEGDLTAVVETVRDITERKAAEALLGDREELYHSLFDNNASVMLLIDPESGAITDANARACSFYGYTRETLKGLKVTDLNTLSEEEVREKIAQVRKEGGGSFEFSHRLADGTTRDVEVFSGPILVRGRPLLCSIVHDVSERRSHEQERERLIQELRAALKEVRTLRGFIPICSSCKKIRDDEGYWKQIEDYLRDLGDMEFSHGICPDCAARLYPELEDET